MTTFGKYDLFERIATGGMAEIFRAQYEPAPGVTKQVVIKRILPLFSQNLAFIGMFTNEAKIAMRLSHGNIAQVFDFGSIEGEYFLAMELVDGYPLSAVINQAAASDLDVMPPEFAAFICAEVLKALHYAHTQFDDKERPLKIVHRDVSPQNVLISFEGQIKLVDFGIAKARNAGLIDSQGSSFKGKYAYFSPEQALHTELDARTDVFATGSVLYELLTGALPFPGPFKTAVRSIAQGNFKRPREINARIPPELERVVLKAMSLDKADRYPTAEAFLRDLNRFLAKNHPEFTGGMVGSLLALLFEEQLVKKGRPAQIPLEFIERINKWKATASFSSAVDDVEEGPTEMVALPDGLENLATPTPSSWVKASVLAMGLVAVGLIALTAMPHFFTSKTKPDELLRSQFRSERPPVSAPSPPALTREEEPEEAATVPDSLNWPIDTFSLDASRHRIDLSSSGATFLKLSADKAYRITLLGEDSRAGWGFYVVSEGGAQPGTFGVAPLLIRSATKFYAFHFPFSEREQRLPPARFLSVVPEGKKKPQMHSISPQLTFLPSQRVTVTGLSPKKAYELTAHQSDVQATHSFNLVVGSPAGVSVAPFEQVTRIERTSTFWVTLLGDAPSAEAGRLDFSLREVSAKKKTHQAEPNP